mgnify:CR=1 FL=1
MSEHPNMTDLLLWRDSCVGEYRNSNGGLCPAVLSATKKSSKTIRHREWGHSDIQDVDKLHSVIERNLKGLIIIMPVSLVHQQSNKTEKQVQTPAETPESKTLPLRRKKNNYLTALVYGKWWISLYAKITQYAAHVQVDFTAFFKLSVLTLRRRRNTQTFFFRLHITFESHTVSIIFFYFLLIEFIDNVSSSLDVWWHSKYHYCT